MRQSSRTSLHSRSGGSVHSSGTARLTSVTRSTSTCWARSSGSDSFFDLDFGLPQLELVNGRFVEADVASLPIVDTDELRNLVLDAAITGGNGTAVIEIPIIGSEAVDRGADELIAEAHRLTKNGIALRVPGIITRRRVSQSALRSWLVFGGTIDEPTISLDEQLAQSTVETLFIDYGDAGDEPTFTVDPAAALVLSAPPLAQSAAPSTRLSESWRGWKQASGSLNSDHEDPDVRGIDGPSRSASSR